MSPVRVQRKRTKGWRMPENTVYVGRGSKWGNPYRIGDSTANEPGGGFITYCRGGMSADDAVELYRQRQAHLEHKSGGEVYRTIRRVLAGKDLACWCPPDRPCHADVLLEIANRSAS